MCLILNYKIMKTQIIPYYRINTTRLAEKLKEISLNYEIINVIRTSSFANAGPVDGEWADYIILYK